MGLPFMADYQCLSEVTLEWRMYLKMLIIFNLSVKAVSTKHLSLLSFAMD